MIKTIKFTNPDDTFIYSDSHFFHDKDFLWGRRGFKSVQEHNEVLKSNWNKKVKPTSILIHLGDFFLNCTVERAKEFLFGLNGHIYYLWGNHNSCTRDLYKESVLENFNLNPDEFEVYPSTWKTKVTFVGNIFNFHVGKQGFVGSHFPLRIFDKSNKGFICLSGHSHGGDKERNPDCFTEGKTMDCSVENFPSPMSITEIMAIMNKKSYKKVDEHH